MRTALALASLLVTGPALAGTLTLQPTEITEWKAVYGRVEARDNVPARARIGGIVVELVVSEGDSVKSGQKIAVREPLVYLAIYAGLMLARVPWRRLAARTVRRPAAMQ